MSAHGFTDVDAMLTDLLDRFERNPAATRLIARIAFDRFADIAEQDGFMARLSQVEATGGVRLLRQGRRGETVITGVALVDPDVLYREAGRIPARDDVGRLLARLRLRTDLPAGAAAVIDGVAAGWERGMSRLELVPGNVRGLERVLDLATAAIRRADEAATEDIDFRTFSRRACGDSKALERHLSAVARVVRQIEPSLSDAALGAAELLATLGVTRLPQPLLIHGVLEIDGLALPDLPFIGIPPQAVLRVRPGLQPTYILTIENYASFVRHVREIGGPRDGIVIYSGGFPSRPVLAAILSLAATTEAPIFHWGDMDLGGVRIFRHLELAMAQRGRALKPHMMDVALLRANGARAPKAVLARTSGIDGSALEHLAFLIATERLVHEQEDLSPTHPLV